MIIFNKAVLRENVHVSGYHGCDCWDFVQLHVEIHRVNHGL